MKLNCKNQLFPSRSEETWCYWLELRTICMWGLYNKCQNLSFIYLANILYIWNRQNANRQPWPLILLISTCSYLISSLFWRFCFTFCYIFKMELLMFILSIFSSCIRPNDLAHFIFSLEVDLPSYSGHKCVGLSVVYLDTLIDYFDIYLTSRQNHFNTSYFLYSLISFNIILISDKLNIVAYTFSTNLYTIVIVRTFKSVQRST